MEFAILAPLMVLIVMGVIDLARGYRMQIRLENAAREGAAYAQLHPNSVSCGSAPDITDRVVAEEDGVASLPDFRVEVFAQDGAGDLTVPVTGCSSTLTAGGERVLVEVSAAFELLTPVVAHVVGGEIDITGSAEIEAQG